MFNDKWERIMGRVTIIVMGLFVGYLIGRSLLSIFFGIKYEKSKIDTKY